MRYMCVCVYVCMYTYTHNWMLLGSKNEWNKAICRTWMDLEIAVINEIRQTEKDKYMISVICGVKRRYK